MSFDAVAEARAIVGETEFLEFDFGTHLEHYTTSRKPRTAFGQTWQPLPIYRSGWTADHKVGATKCKVRMTCQDSLVSAVSEAGLDVIAVKIIRGYGTNYAQDYLDPYFVGWIERIKIHKGVVEGDLVSNEALFKSAYPHILFQPGCNNTLFDPVCSLIRENFEQERTITSVSSGGRMVTFDGVEPALDFFSFGEVRHQGSSLSRFIMKQSENQLVLHIPLTGVAVGDVVVMTPGCNRSVSTCIEKFNNKPNFVGTPLIPITDPVIDGF